MHSIPFCFLLLHIRLTSRIEMYQKTKAVLYDLSFDDALSSLGADGASYGFFDDSAVIMACAVFGKPFVGCLADCVCVTWRGCCGLCYRYPQKRHGSTRRAHGWRNLCFDSVFDLFIRKKPVFFFWHAAFGTARCIFCGFGSCASVSESCRKETPQTRLSHATKMIGA